MSTLAKRAVMVFFAAATTSACDMAHTERSGKMMQESKKIESLVLQLASSNHSLEAVVQLLGGRFTEDEGEYTVHIGKRPFESAVVSRFEDQIDIEFTLSADSLPLGDITGDVQAWEGGPLSPDSSQPDLHRDWEWSVVTIRCVARMARMGGERPAKDDLVQSVGCHIYPK